MSSPKRKRNRPNLAEHEIYFRAGRYVKHRHCNNFIVSKEGGRPEVGKKASLECSKCHRKVGRNGYREIVETTAPELENVVGLGIRWIFLTPEEENQIAVDRGHPLFPRSFSEEAERGVSPKQANDMVAFIAQDIDTSGTVTGRTGRTSPSSALTRDRLKRIKRRALAKRKITGLAEAAALGRAAAKRVQLEDRGLPEQAMEDLAGISGMGYKEARVSYIEKAKEELERCQFDGDAAPAWAVRAVNQHKEARRERAGRIRLDKAIDYEDKVTSLKGCVTGRTETPYERTFRLEHAKRVKKEISDWNRGGYMNQALTGPALDAAAEEALALRRQPESAPGMTWRPAGSIEDTVIKAAKRAKDLEHKVIKAKDVMSKADWIKSRAKKRFYEEN